MSNYQNTLDQLKRELHELRELRDSQPVESTGFDHFQGQAQEKADVLILLETNERELCKLDNAVSDWELAADRAERDRDRSTATWRRATAGIGVASGVLVGLVVLFGPSVGLVVVLLGVLAAAGGAGYQWFREEDRTLEAKKRCGRKLQAARNEREEFAQQVLPGAAAKQ